MNISKEFETKFLNPSLYRISNNKLSSSSSNVLLSYTEFIGAISESFDEYEDEIEVLQDELEVLQDELEVSNNRLQNSRDYLFLFLEHKWDKIHKQESEIEALTDENYKLHSQVNTMKFYVFGAVVLLAVAFFII